VPSQTIIIKPDYILTLQKGCVENVCTLQFCIANNVSIYASVSECVSVHFCFAVRISILQGHCVIQGAAEKHDGFVTEGLEKKMC